MLPISPISECGDPNFDKLSGANSTNCPEILFFCAKRKGKTFHNSLFYYFLFLFLLFSFPKLWRASLTTICVSIPVVMPEASKLELRSGWQISVLAQESVKRRGVGEGKSGIPSSELVVIFSGRARIRLLPPGIKFYLSS